MISTSIFIFLSVCSVFGQPTGPQDFGILDRLVFKTSDCQDCGMTLFGQINVKMCGGTPEPCCAIVNVAAFDSTHFQEGHIDEFTGAQLQDCEAYHLSRVPP